MHLLFVHGARVFRNKNGEKFTDGSYNSELWKRYLALSTNFHVLFRDAKNIIDDNYASKLSKLDESLISVKVAPDDVKPKSNCINPIIQAKINSIVKEEVANADAIIIRMPSGLGERAVKYAIRLNKPYLVESVADVYTAYKYYGNIYGRLLAPIKRAINKHIVYNAPYVLYVSNTFLQNKYPSKGKTIGCPDVLLPKPEEAVLNNRLNRIRSLHDETVLGLIGSLDVNYRGHEVALKTLKMLIDRGYKVRIRFLGGGSPDRWRRIADELNIVNSVEFCGTLPGGYPVMQWIDNIDVLIMPTKQETLGRAIIEAMSRGCPVVGSIETAIGEQIGSDCLALSDDYASFAKIIEKMIVDKRYTEYCAYENFYRSFKYCNEQLDSIRHAFYKDFLSNAKNVKN